MLPDTAHIHDACADHTVAEFVCRNRFAFLPLCSSCFLLLLFSLALPSLCRGQGGMIGSLLIRDSAEQEAIQRDLDIISAGVEIIPAPGGGSFFGEYRKLFGRTNSLNAAISPTVVGRIRLYDKLRLILSTSYIGSGFREVYDAYAFPGGGSDADTLVPSAQIMEDFSISALPVLVGIQYAPIRSQFTSYVGVAAGGAFVTTKWITDTRPFDNSIYSRPETNVETPSFAPAFRFFTGLDLRFDGSMANKNLFRGVYIEAAYLYLPVTIDYFREIRTIGRSIPVLPEENDATLNIGGITITLGVNMQLLRL